MKTLINRMSVILCLMIFSFAGCEAEKEILNQPSEKEVTIKRVSRDDVRRNPRLNQLVNRFKSLRSETSLTRIVYDSLSGLYFDDEKGLYIAGDNKQSYTFPVVKPDPDQKIENICFNLNENGDYDVYLVKYDYTKAEYQTLTKEQLQEKETQFSVLFKNGMVVESLTYVCIDVIAFVSTALVPLDHGDLTGNFGYQGSGGTWVTIASDCFYTTDIGSGFNNGLGNTGSTGNSNGNGTGGTGNGNNTGGIITAGVIMDTENPQTEPLVTTLVGLFSNSLDAAQLAIFNAHPQMRNYLVMTNCTENNMNFIRQLIDRFVYEPDTPSNATMLQLIDVALQHGGELELNDTLNNQNSLVFTDVDEFDEFLNDIDENGFDFEYLDQQNEKIASCKFWIGVPYNGVKVNIKQKMTPSYSVENVSSGLFGITLLVDWNQSDYSVSVLNNVVTVNVYGVSSVKVFFQGIGTFYHESKHLQIKINKLTGEIISSVVINN